MLEVKYKKYLRVFKNLAQNSTANIKQTWKSEFHWSSVNNNKLKPVFHFSCMVVNVPMSMHRLENGLTKFKE